MKCEMGEEIGRMYPHGNLDGELGTPIRIPFNKGTFPYFNILPDGERVPMEYDPKTEQSTKKINIPLL